jgi:hypothetical protein
MDARADRIAAPTRVQDLPLSTRVESPVLKWDQVWRGVVRRADVDARQDRDGVECVEEKGFQHYARARRKMNVMAANGGAMWGALKGHHGYMGRYVAGSCGCGLARCWWFQWMREIYACRLGSWQDQVAEVVGCCGRALGLLWRERT